MWRFQETACRRERDEGRLSTIIEQICPNKLLGEGEGANIQGVQPGAGVGECRSWPEGHDCIVAASKGKQ